MRGKLLFEESDGENEKVLEHRGEEHTLWGHIARVQVFTQFFPSFVIKGKLFSVSQHTVSCLIAQVLQQDCRDLNPGSYVLLTV
jgi:hypothetical protein